MEGNNDHFRSKTSLILGVKLWQIISPILIILGSIGNVLTIIILSRARFRKNASTIYLFALAAFDLCFLYVGLLRQWIKYTFDVDIRHQSVVVCKIHWWLMFTVADCTVWVLTVITVERLLATIIPHRSKSICKIKVAKIVLLIMTCTILVINCHLLYGFGPLQVDMGNITITLPCVPINEEYEKFFSDVWTWIDLCKYSLVPFAFLAGGNACIVCKMFINKKKLKTQIRPSGTNPSSQQDEKLSNMSMLLVGLNIMFIVCTLPVCVYFIGEPYWIPKDIPKQIQLQDPWWAFVNLLMYTNSCLNFVLYCLTGSRFRGEVRRLFTSHKLARTGTLNVTEHATSQRDF